MRSTASALFVSSLLAWGCGSDRARAEPDATGATEPPVDAPRDTTAEPDAEPAPDAATDGSACGNGVCDPWEDDVACPEDCGCANGGCVFRDWSPCQCTACCWDFGNCCSDADTECGIVGTACGNGVCDTECENSAICAQDC